MRIGNGDDPRLRAQGAAIDIDDIAQHLECVKRDANQQHHRQRMRVDAKPEGTEQEDNLIQKEASVFKVTLNAQIHQQTQDQHVFGTASAVREGVPGSVPPISQ